jgi:hypothetical protein
MTAIRRRYGDLASRITIVAPADEHDDAERLLEALRAG